MVGTFNTSKTYAIYMYANEYNGGEYIPSCNNATVTSSTTLSCTISGIVDYNYRFRYVVKEVERGKYITIQGTLAQLKPIPKPSIAAKIQAQFILFSDRYSITTFCVCLIALCIVLCTVTVKIFRRILQYNKMYPREDDRCTRKQYTHYIESKTLI